MQHDQVQQQEHEDRVDGAAEPADDEGGQEGGEGALGG